MPRGTTFIGQIFYGSIGYTMGASLGCLMAVPEHRRVFIFIGDGSFQVTGQELSSMIRHKKNPVLFLINNEGYTIERVILDGAFNDIQPWNYSKLPEVFSGKEGSACKVEGELEDKLKTLPSKELAFFEVFCDRWDCSEALKKAGQAMAELNIPAILREQPAQKHVV